MEHSVPLKNLELAEEGATTSQIPLGHSKPAILACAIKALLYLEDIIASRSA
jgi:hypothetical protein